MGPTKVGMMMEMIILAIPKVDSGGSLKIKKKISTIEISGIT